MPDKRAHWEQRHGEPGRPIGEPSPFLVELLPKLPAGNALDLACGSGRHSLALARAGHCVTAVDFASTALRRLRQAADAEGLAVDPVQADLENYPLPTEQFAVAVKMFYLQRDLFEPLKRALQPGGIAIIETFLVDQREIGHPRNPRFLLDRGELRDRFADFEILGCREGLVDSGGEKAYLSSIAARKPN